MEEGSKRTLFLSKKENKMKRNEDLRNMTIEEAFELDRFGFKLQINDGAIVDLLKGDE